MLYRGLAKVLMLSCVLSLGCTPSPVLGLIESEDVEGIRQFYKTGDGPNSVIAGNGTTALLYAFRQHKKASFTALLESGADPNAKCGINLSVMHYSAEASDSFWLKEALRFKGNPNLLDSGASNHEKGRVLWFAIRSNKAENVNLLLDAGADLDGIIHNGMTPLASALKYSLFDIAILLLNRGADCLTSGQRGDTALFWLKPKLTILERFDTFDRHQSEQLMEIKRLFKEKGCDPDKAEWNGGSWNIKK